MWAVRYDQDSFMANDAAAHPIRDFIKSHRVLRVPLMPVVRLARKVFRPEHERRFSAFRELWTVVEGGSLVVGLPTFRGSFEIGSHSEILQRILVTGNYEPEVARIVCDNIDPNRDAIDVGANVGLFTVLLSNLLSPANRVLAIEPTPGALKYLRRNIETNGQGTRVVVFDGVASNAPGEARLMEEYSTLGAMAHPAVSGRSHQQLAVASDTIDSLVSRFGLRPGFLKIDTEGSEHDVLLGCEQTMLTHRPIVLCEAWADSVMSAAGRVPGAVAALLNQRGYVASECADGELLAIPTEIARTRAVAAARPR
jgi:FkbM family methyltransferase